MTDNEAAKKYAESLGDGLYFGNSPMTRARIHAFMKGANWKEEQLIKKVVEYLDSLMYYVSEQDRRLVCNFTKFDEFIEDLKQTVSTKND